MENTQGRRDSSKQAGLVSLYQLIESRVPLFVGVFLTWISTVILQTLAHPLVFQSILFTCLVSVHYVLYALITVLKRSHVWLFVVGQGALILLCGWLMPDGFQATGIGLYTILIAQSIGIYYRVGPVLLTCFFSFVMVCSGTALIGKPEYSILEMLIVMIPFVICGAGYSVVFFREVHMRMKIQVSLNELEVAHQQVEELTLANERQRMARDLHDTLAQGVAGIALQLEAVKAHLGKGNTKRAQEIVQQSIVRAKEALADARGVIDDLRMKSETSIDFVKNVKEDVQRFITATGIPCSLELSSLHSFPPLVVEHGTRMISECLTNIARHSHASHVRISIQETTSPSVVLIIQDNGVGFDFHSVGNQPGHYGLLGIQERVRILHGDFKIESKKDYGTSIEITIPLKGEEE